MQDNKFIVPLAIVVAGAMIAGAIYLGGNKSASAPTPKDSGKNTTEIDLAPITAKDHILGDPNAEIVVVEYSDLECPFCKVFHNTMHDIVDAYGGKVAWAYRHFPIAQLHTKAIKESEATECAAELGGNSAFWKYTDRVFEVTRSNDTLDLAELPRIAGEIGLDVEAFNDCLSSGRHVAAIEKSVEDAVKAGARGTPYSVIVSKGGKKVVINGAESFASVKTKIDPLLR